MRTRHTRIAAATAALAAGVLAAMSLQPGAHATQTLAARNPAVEVRTQVIHRTVHVSGGGRHGAAPARGPAGTVGLRARARLTAARPAPAGRTPGQRSHRPLRRWRPAPARDTRVRVQPASATPPVATRPSPGHAECRCAGLVGRLPVHPPQPRASAGASASSGAPVSTHTSGSRHGDDHGERRGDD